MLLMNDKKPEPFKNNESNIRLRSLSLLLILLLVSWLIMSHGIHGQFLLDDSHNLGPIAEYLQSPSTTSAQQFVFNNKSGPLGRPVSMASFLVDIDSMPPDVSTVVRNNIFIHLFSGLLVFWFCLLLFSEWGKSEQRAYRLALLVSAIWLLHPLQVSTYLYVIQRMTLLGGAFTFLSLIAYLKVRRLFFEQSFWRKVVAMFAVGLPLALGILSKENSFSALSLIGLIELSISIIHKDRLSILRKTAVYLAIASTPAALVAWMLIKPDAYAYAEYFRGFNLWERLISQPRIIWDYLSNIIIPSRVGTGVFHDDIVASKSLLSPVTTLPAILGIIAVAATTLIGFRKQPILLFGVAWYLIWHLVESSILPLELKYEHRNYVPILGIVISGVLICEMLTVKYAATRFIPLAFLVACSAVTFQSMQVWSSPLIQAELWQREHPKSVRAAQHATAVFTVNNMPDHAIQSLRRAGRENPQQLNTQLQVLSLACRYNIDIGEDLNVLYPAMQNAKIDATTPKVLENLFKNFSELNCTNIELKDILKLANSLTENPGMQRSKHIKAETLMITAKIYTYLPDYPKCAEFANRAFQTLPDGRFADTEVRCWIDSKRPLKAFQALDRARAHSHSGQPDPIARKKVLDGYERVIKSIKQ